MKRAAFVIVVCVSLVLLAGLTLSQDQGSQLPGQRVKPNITSVSQDYYYQAVNLVLNGTNFPSKNTGPIWRLIRLRTAGSGDGTKGHAYYTGYTGNWTPTRVDDMINYDVPLGQKFKIGLIQYNESNANDKLLISNEVEFLVRMSLDSVTPDPVPFGTNEIKVATTNVLGPQGSKIVVLSHTPAQVTQWGGPPPLNWNEFKVRIPASLPRPAIYDLWVQDGNSIVSRMIQVKLRGPLTPVIK